MAATPHLIPRTVEDVFNDFKGRRAGVVKALTVDFRQFYQQCAPGTENLCLYGLPNETWEVKLPVEKVPPELPEPAVGINFGRRGMPGKDWLSRVAAHSESWLLNVAFYYGGLSGFGKSHRSRLFEMISDYTTVCEEVKQWTSLCGACGEEGEEEDEFWICCKVCDKWFHRKCVKITPAQAQHINQYRCPNCSNKKFQPQRA